MKGVEHDPLAIPVCAHAALIDEEPGHHLKGCGIAVSFHEGSVYQSATLAIISVRVVSVSILRPHHWWIVLSADPSKEITGFLPSCKEI